MQGGMNTGYGQQGRPPMGMQGGMRPPGMYQQGGMYNSGPGHYMQQRFHYQSGARGPPAANMGQQQQQMQQAQMMGAQRPHQFGMPYDSAAKGPKRPMQRRTIDYYGSTVRGLELRAGGKGSLKHLPSDPSYTVDVFPSTFVPDEPETSLTTRLAHAAANKDRFPINVIRWTPEGRRLITGSSRGELTLWNGLTFNFETILQAHDCPIRSMEWSHDSQWMISCDHYGIIKYWQPNLDNVKVFHGHKDPARGLSFSPTDTKFVSASDDQTLKIWDFLRSEEEKTLVGHAWEVRAVDWHPFLGMIASGGKDNTINIWDPRTGKCLVGVRRHNNSINGLRWNRNGNWLLSGGRDHCVKLFDVRKLKEEIHSFATPREVHSIAWHPVHETMFVSGGSLCEANTKDATNEGTIQFWTTDDPKQKGCVEGAHASYVWSLAWHPMGHLLASGSNDHTTKFWARPRPGEHLPTELGSLDEETDVRIFGGPPNTKAAEQLASYAREKGAADAAPLSAGANGANSGGAGGGPPRPPPPPGGLPGLQSADVGRMLAKLKKEGLPGLSSQPSNFLPGLSGTSNVSSSQGMLPGLRRPPPPPSLPPPQHHQQQQHHDQGRQYHRHGHNQNQNQNHSQGHGQGGPMRNHDSGNRQRQSSRFNPMHHGNNNGTPPPPPPSSRPRQNSSSGPRY
ncbi:WD repeat-containing protein 33 [Coemansia sp. Benny D115]|nr:WD repeat-containing protein 33 [Coemansia sp. Benny D115]